MGRTYRYDPVAEWDKMPDKRGKRFTSISKVNKKTGRVSTKEYIDYGYCRKD